MRSAATLSLAASLVAGPALAAESVAPKIVHTLDTEAGPVKVERLVQGLLHPWAVEPLPDGRLLISERDSGDLYLYRPDGTLEGPLAGTPEVFAQGQGGLLDIALHPDFADNGLVYLSFAESGPGGASTAVGRGRLGEGGIEGFETIWRQTPKVPGPNHFGGRILFSRDAKLFVALGERFKFDPAQDLSNHLGTIVRLNPDGSIPDDNPFVGQQGAAPAIWSYGHRNIEGADLHPETGQLWVAEMGPRGGDELNRVEPGANYGWPVVSWGEHYSGEVIPDPPTRPEFLDAVEYWVPSISPSGMIFYTGELFPEWQGDILLGGLTSGGPLHLELREGQVVGQQVFQLGVRIRDVVQGPAGEIYMLTEQADADLWRLTPAQ